MKVKMLTLIKTELLCNIMAQSSMHAYLIQALVKLGNDYFIQVLADRIYPLKEFRKVKENFLVS